MGFTRGGTREIVTLVAFFVAIIVSIWLKPWLMSTFHLGEAGSYVSVVVIFIGCYFGIRYMGHSLSDKLQKDKVTHFVDRALGLGFGIVRTLIFLGVFHLIFCKVTPIEYRPAWFKTAKVYPLSVWSAKTVQQVLPEWLKIANQVAPNIAKNTDDLK